jgi:hypothetical protein
MLIFAGTNRGNRRVTHVAVRWSMILELALWVAVRSSLVAERAAQVDPHSRRARGGGWRRRVRSPGSGLHPEGDHGGREGVAAASAAR